MSTVGRSYTLRLGSLLGVRSVIICRQWRLFGVPAGGGRRRRRGGCVGHCELVHRHHQTQRHRWQRLSSVDRRVVLQFQLMRELGELPRLAHLVLVDDRVQVLREKVLRFRLVVQVRLRLDELPFRTVVTFPATSN